MLPTHSLREGFTGQWFDELLPLADQLLSQAELAFGERDPDWKLIGVQWGKRKHYVANR